jgi:uncharacterized membrane protein YfcA
MNYGVHDFVGNLGVVVVLVTYLLLQMDRMAATSLTYSITNAIGAVLILISLAQDFNLSAVIIESVWLIISIFGMARTIVLRRNASAAADS